MEATAIRSDLAAAASPEAMDTRAHEDGNGSDATSAARSDHLASLQLAALHGAILTYGKNRAKSATAGATSVAQGCMSKLTMPGEPHIGFGRSVRRVGPPVAHQLPDAELVQDGGCEEAKLLLPQGEAPLGALRGD